MHVIRKGAAREDVFADIRTTLANAKGKGEPFAKDAEEFLGPVLADVAANEAATKAEDAALAAVNAERIVQVQKLKDQGAATHDDLYNRTGRTKFDRVFERWYAGSGFSVYTDKPPERLPVSIRINAMRLAKNPHPMVAPEVIAEMVAVLRTEAEVLEKINARFDPISQEVELLDRELTTLGARGQRELARLKSHWSVSPGLSDHDIFQIIPGYSTPKKKKAAAQTETSGGTTASGSGASAAGASGSGASATGTPGGGSTGPASGETPPTA